MTPHQATVPEGSPEGQPPCPAVFRGVPIKPPFPRGHPRVSTSQPPCPAVFRGNHAFVSKSKW